MSGVALVAQANTVFAELWISFSGLTRSHLAALEITGRLKQVEVIEERGRLQLIAPAATLHIAFDVDNGHGTWTRLHAKHGTSLGKWQIFEDATVRFIVPKSTMDVELAVEKFCAMLMV